MADLGEQVADALGAIGLVVALVTLYTGELERRRAAASESQSKATRDYPAIRYQAIAVLAVTLLALFGVWPLVWETSATLLDSWTISTGLWLFGVIWLLLNGLAVWQASIVARTIEYGSVKGWLTTSVTGLLAASNIVLVLHGVATQN